MFVCLLVIAKFAPDVVAAEEQSGAPACTFIEAVKNGSAQRVRQLLSTGNGCAVVDVSASSEQFSPNFLDGCPKCESSSWTGLTAVQHAVLEHNLAEAIRFESSSFEERASHPFRLSRLMAGWTALHYAILANDTNVSRVLLDNGANTSAVANGPNGRIRWNPLHLAAMHGAAEGTEVLELLLQRKDVDVESAGSGNVWTPLFYAVFSGNVGAVQVLLAHGANVNARSQAKYRLSMAKTPDSCCEPHITPLILAAALGNSEVVKALLQAEEVDVNAIDGEGRTALHHSEGASKYDSGKTEANALLLSRGADPLARDVFGRTPLFEAAESPLAENVRLLLEYGADASMEDKSDQFPEDVARLLHYTETEQVLHKARCLEPSQWIPCLCDFFKHLFD